MILKKLIVAIKQYIVSLVISHSQNPELMEREKVYLNKLNIILVQVNEIYFLNCNKMFLFYVDFKT
jgi:hypothetical protein